MKPKRLQPGDTIGLIAPSRCVGKEVRDNLNQGILFLENNGFQVRLSPNFWHMRENADCLLVVTRCEGDAVEPIYANHSAGFSPVYRFDDGEGLEPWISWASPIRWSPAQYDDFILAVANEEIYNTLFISPSLGGIYAPYDGGADVFQIDAVRLSAIKARYQEWASKRPDGL